MSEDGTPLSARHHHAQARLAIALEAAQLGLWEWDLATGALVWDARSITLFGLDGLAPAELTGTVADIERGIHPEDLARVQQVLDQAMAERSSVEVEFRTRWPDGSIHWVHARGQVLVGTDGQAVRVVGTNADVTATRATAQQAARDGAARASLVATAHALGGAQSEAQVLAVVTDHGSVLLGAQGMGLAIHEPAAARVRTLSTAFEAEFLASVAHLPEGFALPLVDTARSGREHFFCDLPSTQALFSDTEAIYSQTGTQASVAVPLLAGEVLVGCLSVAYDQVRDFREAERELLRALAALVAQALARISAREAERVAAAQVAALAERLQRSLLTTPAGLGSAVGVQVGTGYVPAADQVQVGGDWFDAFTTAAGTTTVVIGDVTGHDSDAAAAMAQLRNLLRGVAFAVDQAPARVLGVVDEAMGDLGLGFLASAVLAQVEPVEAVEPLQPVGEVDLVGVQGPGRWRLRWSNAGHPPPLLVDPDGSARLLSADSDLLLGLDLGIDRADHEVVVEAGSVVVLYTDGLIERRGVHLQRGLDWLCSVGPELVGLDAEQLCAWLLGQVGQAVEDDVAVLAVRFTG